jgi:hypothetical protein
VFILKESFNLAFLFADSKTSIDSGFDDTSVGLYRFLPISATTIEEDAILVSNGKT